MVKSLLDNIIDIFSEEIARLDKKIDMLEQKSNGSKYLTPEQRKEICESKESVKNLAILYKRTRQQIYNIKRNGK